jgi:hypothetical protein
VLRFLNDHDVLQGRPTGVGYILEETRWVTFTFLQSCVIAQG